MTYTGPEAFTENEDWVICLWPDGTWCNEGELRYYSHVSDDFEKHVVLSYDEAYCPIKTRKL